MGAGGARGALPPPRRSSPVPTPSSDNERVLERRQFPNGVIALVSATLEAEGFLAAFTERERGASEGQFRSLNLGLRTGDDANRAAANRSRVCEALGISTFACGRQVHGANVEWVRPERVGSGFADPSSAFDRTDALVTPDAGVALAILTADCFPVALVNPAHGKLAVVHAGWRGVAAGILGKAIAAFEDARFLMAVVGPGIGADHYEVGADVASAVSAGAEGDAVIGKIDGRIRLDLGATIERSLRACGIQHVESAGVCTACEEERFFSYRRDGITGRQGLIAMRLS